jgi:hypothetical protein
MNTQTKLLKKGDVIKLKKGHKVYVMLPETEVYSNGRDGKFTSHDVKIGGKYKYLKGEYVVVKTKMEGGGTGHGPGDIYPDGHHVFCKRADGQKVNFYQTGCFTAMIEDIEPIGHVTIKSEKQQLKEALEALETLVNMYVANRGGDSEFITCITPKHACDLTPTARKRCSTWKAWDNARKVLGETIKPNK